jgi:peroxiredoxin
MFRSACCLVLISSGLAMAASGELSNRRAPGFALPDPSYQHYYDLQDYAGKVVLIEIMSTRCPHCLLLSTTLERVKARYGEKVAILSVVLPPDNQDTISKFIATNNITVTVLCDMGQMTASYFKATPSTISTVTVPHLFVIDKQGTIRNDFAYEPSTMDVFEGAALFTEIDKLLK